MRGTVRRLIRGKGFGFIITEDRQYFFHHSEVRDVDFKRLRSGDIVEFEAADGTDEGRNPRAISVIVVEKAQRRPPVSQRAPRPLQDATAPQGRPAAGATADSRREARVELTDDEREFVTEMPRSLAWPSRARARTSGGPGRDGKRRGGPRRGATGNLARERRRPKASGQAGDRGEGVVRSLDADRGFGFIETPSGDVFFHKSSVKSGLSSLNVGVRVAFTFEIGERGTRADDVVRM